MKNFFWICFIILLFQNVNAQSIKSPDDFLGYTLGKQYTRHHRVVEYFEYVAKSVPTLVKFTQYGLTNEKRSLNLAYVSSEKNLQNLEQIKKDNLVRAKINNGTAVGNVAIVWLSYNVHGNEPSSSEAAMLTLYELVTKQAKGWLENTLVIIDPCLNPDGRDRYVNWFNGMVGVFPNPYPMSREHMEPWPQGRPNHYYFDLNRDWAWQTQVETQQRIKVYNQWLPHIHVDFHEQGYNEPYYFAPAAEPMHEVITQWQKDFQTIIGKNHAKYFDANGWYYFTKERFDLFYPSYGDTYPTFNGSIGMTYEQGGHSMGGLTITQDNGETLTLVDRVQHHHTTGMSTVEIASKNAKALVDNFSTYFSNSVNAVGSQYKTYILTSNSKNKIDELKKLLENNDIASEFISKATGNGYHYGTQKIQPITLEKYSISVSAYQPKSLLAKVLLEPQSKLSDTATYDITGWSLPYAYNVTAFASTEKLTVQLHTMEEVKKSIPESNYAYFVRYNSLSDAILFSQLLHAGTKIYINEKDIYQNGQLFEKGTLIIPKKENKTNWSAIVNLLTQSKSEITSINTGFAEKGPDLGSPDIKFIHAPKIAIVSGEESSPGSFGELWHFFDHTIQYPSTQINIQQINLTTLKNFDVLIVPHGDYKMLSNKNNLDDLKTWLKLGGRLIVIEGAAIQLANAEMGVKLKKEAEKTDEVSTHYEDLKIYENRDRDDITNYIPGAIYEVDIDNTHPLGFGFGKKYYTLKQNSDVIEFSKNIWNVGTVKKNKKVSGFAGKNVLDKIKDGTVIGVQSIENGSIIYFIDNPIFRSFWQSGKMLLFNAAFLVGNNAMRL